MSDISAAFERLYRRVMMSIWKGRIHVVNDSGPVQMVQIAFNQSEVRDNTPRLAEYGFSSVPPPGSDVVALCLGGDRSSAVVVATNHQGSRKTGMQPGDVAIYDNRGQYIALTAAGIVIHSTIGVFIQSPGTEATGEITDRTKIGGGSSMSSLRDAYNAHVHPGVAEGNDNTKEPDKKA